jgi:trans-aconitate methyltransferase
MVSGAKRSIIGGPSLQASLTVPANGPRAKRKGLADWPPITMLAGMKRPLVMRALGVAGRLVNDRHYRNAMLVRLERPLGLFQPDNHTVPDRYPELFDIALREIGDGPDRRLLSFGCSTGEEVFALRGRFRAACIDGLDINRRNIAIARARLAAAPDDRIVFRAAGSGADLAPSSYDAIFCMAVFRHGSLGDAVFPRCDHRIRFADFDRTLVDLAASLRPGGLMFIEWSNFRFHDTRAFAQFEAAHAAPQAARPDPIYDRSDRLMPGVTYRDVVFRKRLIVPPPAPAAPGQGGPAAKA